MAERTDRQAQIDGMFDACRQVANSLPLFVIVGTTAMANPLGSDLEHTDERRFNPSGKVFARVEDAAALLRERDAQIANMGANQLVLQEAVATQSDLIATLRAERDAAQQERDGWRKAFGIQTTSGWTTPEAMKERHDDAWRRYQERGTALQQENKTLREALEEVTEHLESQRDIQLNNGYPEEYAAIGKARAALSSSPRPQEPQP